MDIIYKLLLEYSDIVIGVFFGFCLGNIFQILMREKFNEK